MKLKILLPTEVLLEEDVSNITAEAENGAFGIYPNHIDFVTALAPGILSFEADDVEETFVAVDEGILVKCGSEVLVSTRQAVRGASLETLEQTVSEEFRKLDERQRQTRSALAKLESGFVRRFIEMGG
ncbi:MAG: F0F1 ATP synthase subunit epsilon [Elainellaceae cyanobacterium]